MLLYDKKRERLVKFFADKNGLSNSTFIVTNDTQNLIFSKKTQDLIRKEKRKVIWMSQCTQINFLTAIEKFQAPIVGFANEVSYSHT